MRYSEGGIVGGRGGGRGVGKVGGGEGGFSTWGHHYL